MNKSKVETLQDYKDWAKLNGFDTNHPLYLVAVDAMEIQAKDLLEELTYWRNRCNLSEQHLKEHYLHKGPQLEVAEKRRKWKEFINQNDKDDG